MKIEFSRSGGFAAPAMKQKVEIDTDDLPENEADELLNLVDQADLTKVASQPKNAPRPDAFRYKISVSNEGLTQTATTSDADMPEALQPLIEWLEKRVSEKN